MHLERAGGEQGRKLDGYKARPCQIETSGTAWEARSVAEFIEHGVIVDLARSRFVRETRVSVRSMGRGDEQCLEDTYSDDKLQTTR